MLITKVDRAHARWGQSFEILRNIVRDEGSYGALYRGLMPNLIGNSVSWAIYFLL
jgi:solute carrier family 25 (mitochondrial folate transporter), member 32